MPSPIDLAAELADMREQVPFAEDVARDARAKLEAQIARTTAVYGEDVSRWPASSAITVDGLRLVTDAADRSAAEARRYLDELEAREASL